MKKSIVGFSLAFLIAFSFTGCLVSPRKTAEKVSETTSQSSKKEDTNKVFNKGDTVKYGDCQLTVTKVEKSQGEDYHKAKSGKEFVIVTVKIKNTGKKTLDYNPLYFQMQNSKGQLDNVTYITINQDTELESGKLTSGGEVEGSVVFEEPKDDEKLVLQYQDNFFADGAKIMIKCS